MEKLSPPPTQYLKKNCFKIFFSLENKLSITEHRNTLIGNYRISGMEFCSVYLQNHEERIYTTTCIVDFAKQMKHMELKTHCVDKVRSFFLI